MASERKLQAASEARAVDRGNRRKGKIGDTIEKSVQSADDVPGLVGLEHPVEFPDVGPNDKIVFLGAYENQGLGKVVDLDFGQHALQFQEHSFREHVDPVVRIIDEYDQDAVFVPFEFEETH